MDSGRRNFARIIFKKAIDCLSETRTAYEQGVSEVQYFSSFENAYPLISESYDFLEEEAGKLGIDIRNKSKLELAREIHMSLKQVEV